MKEQLKEFFAKIVRILHIVVGIGALAVPAWFMYAITPSTPYGFRGAWLQGRSSF